MDTAGPVFEEQRVNQRIPSDFRTRLNRTSGGVPVDNPVFHGWAPDYRMPHVDNKAIDLLGFMPLPRVSLRVV